MKIKYEFATETLETDDADNRGTILANLDQEYDIDHSEKRCHYALDVFSLDGALFPSNEDVLRGIFKPQNDKRLNNAITKLETCQQKLIRRAFFEGRGYTHIARCESRDESVSAMPQPVH